MNEQAPVLFPSGNETLPFSYYSGETPWAGAVGAGATTSSLAIVIGDNVRTQRKRHGLSLEKLARQSGVSRAMLSQIELGRSTPTVLVLWKIACALKTPLQAFLSEAHPRSVRLLPAVEARRLLSGDGSCCLRALFPADHPVRRVEFYELRLKSCAEEVAKPHPPGTLENLVVSGGVVEIAIDKARHLLTAGDAIEFAADVAHGYRNVGTAEAVLYLVMTYSPEGE